MVKIFGRTSVKFKILINTVLMGVIPGLLIGLLSLNQVKTMVTRNIEQDRVNSSKSLANQIEQFVQDNTRLIKGLSDLPSLREGAVNQKSVNRELQAVGKVNPQFALIFATDLSGKQFGRSDGQNKWDNLGDKPYFKQMAETKQPVVSDVVVSQTTKKPSVVIACPLYDPNGELVGMVGGTLDLNSLSQLASRYTTGETGYAFVTDIEGVVLAHPRASLVDQRTNLSDLSVVQHALKGESSYATYTFEGIYKIGAYTFVPSTKWAVVMTQNYAEAFASYSSAMRTDILIITIALLIICCAGLFLNSRLLKPFGAVVESLETVAAGNFAVQLNIPKYEEFIRISSSFNKMVGNTRQLIEGVIQSVAALGATVDSLSGAVDSTSENSGQVKAAVQRFELENRELLTGIADAVVVMGQLDQVIGQIAHSSQAQAGSVSEASGMFSEMDESIGEVDSSTEKVGQSVKIANETVEKGQATVEDTIKGMDEIRSMVFDTAAKIKRLGEQSSKIGEIIEVIDDIAEQTNLLALNAAIEAARAGEHGKGFAVVADEVRKLAERSGKATKEIADLITGIQRVTREAVGAMECGTVQVEAGTGLAYKAGEALNRIMETIGEVEEQVRVITAAINSVSGQSKEIVSAVSNVAAITEENSAATEEMAASSAQTTETIQQMSRIAEGNAVIMEQVSGSVGDLENVVTALREEIAGLREMSGRLTKVAGRFKLN